MFTHLIESGSHKKDLARKGRFFLGTLGFYGLLLMVVGVASVYAYNEQLGTQDLEVTLITPVPVTQIERNPQVVRAQPKYTSGSGATGQLTRTEIIANTTNSTLIPKEISTRPGPPPSPPGAKLGDKNIGDGIAIGPPNNNSGEPGPPSTGIVVAASNETDPLPPPPRVKATPAPAKPPEQVRLSSVLISSKIITKPAPVYPAIAKQVGAQGAVTVEILIDEQGRVVSARATNGHPLLRAAAQSSAYQARFSPTSISGHAVKVSGVITYNFILR